MKKVIFLAVLIFNFHLSIFNSLHAQGFEWVRTYTGADISSGVAANKLVGSCVDSAGNLYILGEFSPQAQLCGVNLLPREVIVTPRNSAVVIAKLSPSGELLWHKAIYNGKESCYAHALRMVGDSSIMVMVRFFLPYRNSVSYYRDLYYLDTLLTGNDDYLMPTDSVSSSNYTAFITFDFDGNAIERHLVCVGYSDANDNALTLRFIRDSSYSDILTAEPLSGESFNIDSEGNIYVIRYANDIVTGLNYHRWRIDDGTIGSMKIVVDGTQIINYPIPYRTALWNQQIMKFSPHFDSLLGAVYMFDSTLYRHLGGTIKINSFKIDAQNNLYVAMRGGRVPAHLRIANSNSLCLGDSIEGSTWIIKYNSDLYATDLIQLSYTGSGVSPLIDVCDSYVDESTNSLFVSGAANWFEHFTTIDNIIYKNDTLDIPAWSGYWLRLDRDNLNVLSMGRVLPGEDGQVYAYPRLEMKNNRIFSEIGYLWSMVFGDTTIYANNYSDYDHAFAIWNYNGDGLFIRKHGLSNGSNKINHPIAIDSIVYITGTLRESATFDTIEIHNQGASQAFIAKYVDPEFARPYVHPSDRQEQSIIWQQELFFNLADSLVTLTATSTSGLPIAYTCNDSTIAYPDGTTLYLLRNGTTTVTASQQGDYYYFPAEPVTKTLRVSNTGIHDPQHSTLNTQLSVYPNPTSDALFIIPNGEPITAVRLLSSLGRQEQVILANNKIDLSHLPAGVYFLSITTSSNNYQYKIVKR